MMQWIKLIYIFKISILLFYNRNNYVSGSRKRDLMEQIKKIEFFMLIKSYNLSQLSAKILEGKAFDVQRNWQT